jgi:hypothetical protein
MHLERNDPVNWSTLKNILISPRHYLHRLTEPRKDTPALQLGRVIHTAVLEPQLLELRYIVSPRFHRGMKDETAIAAGYDGGKSAAAEWDEQAAKSGAEVVSTEAMATALAIRGAVRLPHGERELKITWTDLVTGIDCRGTIDHLAAETLDLKSIADISACDREAARRMYHAQLAWYYDGLAYSGRSPGRPTLLFVESVPPHDSARLIMDDDSLAAGRRLYRRALGILRDCRASGVWTGVAPEARPLRLPAWALAEEPVELVFSDSEGEI